jgi:hypothetical protein
MAVHNLLNMQSTLLLSVLISVSLISCLQKADTEIDEKYQPTYLDDTRKMAQEGKYQEALDRYLWFHDNILEQDTGMAGVRLSFALSYWKELGEVYPPAMDALIDKRDAKTHKIKTTGTSKDLFADVAAINRTLKENSKTIQLFEIVSQKYPLLAKDACRYALNDLLDSRRYDLIQKNIGNIIDHYKRIEATHRKSFKEIANEKSLKSYMEKRFVENVIELIEYCLAVDDLHSASEIQARSLELVYDKRIKNAIPNK